MGILSWLFGPRVSPAPDAPAVVVDGTGPPRHSVFVPDDLAARLTAGGQPLQDAVERALLRALEPARPAEIMPFWLERGEPAGDLADELRDRVAQRRASETDS